MKKPAPTLSQTPIPVAPDAPPLEIPLYGQRIPAGFPSPATDYVDNKVDLNRYLVSSPSSTFLLTVKGDSMNGIGIHEGDVIVVDASIEAKHGDVVVAEVNGEFTLKRLYRRGGKLELRAENPAYAPIVFREGDELVVFGVVVWSLKPLHKRG